MSKDDSSNPFEELQAKLRDALQRGDFNLSAGFPGGASGVQAAPTPPKAPAQTAEDDEILERIRHFSLKPREIRDHLDRFVVKQDEAKKVLSVAICDHYNHVRQCLEKPALREQNYHKQNVLLLGPTGVGKTYLMRTIAKLIGVPFVKADATKFSETGYVGSDVEDLVRDLNRVAGGNPELAQYGIIYIDEIDKIAAVGDSGGKDVSGRGVQINLLKLMEEADVNLHGPNDMMAQMQMMMSPGRGGAGGKRQINTRHILFIVSGAFDKLAESVKKRADSASVGFGGQGTTARDAGEYLRDARTADFIKYGFEPEFIGRLPVRVSCEPLGIDDLSKILTASEGNLLEQYRQDFKGYGIDFKITTEAIAEIARRAHEERTGARGLMTVFEQVFRYFKFELPSTGIESFEVTAETVSDPTLALKDLLKKNAHLQRSCLGAEIGEFARRFEEAHELKLVFTPEACDVLIDLAVDSDKTIRSICEDRFKDFQHGLKIVSRNSGQTDFEITAAVARDPDGQISKMVVESFKHRPPIEEEANQAEASPPEPES